MKELRYILICTCITLFSMICDAQVSRNMSQLGYLSTGSLGGALNDIWGYADTLGNEYAIVGIQSGVVFVDVTIPSSPVLLHTITATSSTWRDMRVYNDFAYVTCEEPIGLMIVDLRYIQDSVPYIFSDLGIGFDDAHNITIDENGIAYLVGGGGGPTNGAVMIDLNPDPWNPVHLGNYTTNYIHDAIVRNDTMYSSEIYTGKFAVVDVTNKTSPSVIATQATSANFTHQAWLSDDSDFLFAVDEVSGAFIDAFDISDLSNIEKVDRIQSNPGSGVIPHNTFYLNGYLVTSYYRDGVIVTDASRPHNLCQIGYYDTYTAGSGNGFQGCWGVYPYLPSGNIIASDRNTGLHILSANYQRGCYVEGKVTDACSGVPLSVVTVEILGGFTGNSDVTGLSGDYAVATVDAGIYDIVFSKSGYVSDTLKNISLSNGVLSVQNVTLSNGVSTVTVSSINGTDVTCNGGENGEASASALGGTSPYSFVWSTGNTGSTVINLQAGAYTVTVTDLLGCTASRDIIISEPASINVTTSKSNVSCAGGSNGSANAIANGGNAPYSYSWDTNPVKTTQSVSGLSAGIFNLTVIDADGCIKQVSLSISVPAQILTFNIPTNPTGGGSNGSINLLVSGGVNPYLYNWSTGANTEDVVNLNSGFYFCQVSDRNGCADIETVTLAGPPAMMAGNGQTGNLFSKNSSLEIFPNPGKGQFELLVKGFESQFLNIAIYDLQGKAIHSQVQLADTGVERVLVSMPTNLPEGLYLVKIRGSEQVSTLKYLLSH